MHARTRTHTHTQTHTVVNICQSEQTVDTTNYGKASCLWTVYGFHLYPQNQ